MVDNVEMETKEVQKIPWEKSIWFFDIDDTLIDTAGNTLEASEAIKKVFQKKHGIEKATEVQENYMKIFNLMLSGHQATSDHGKNDYDELVARIESMQTRVVEKYGSYKKWSREIFIKIAADDANISVEPETVSGAADAYWLDLTEKTELFSGVKELMEDIRNHERPIYLITSSDARLKMDEAGQFDYDPEYSEKLKRERINNLKSKGIVFNGLSIGDPEDKPHLDFFEKGMQMAADDLGHQVDFQNAIMVGDSFAGDLEVPKDSLKFGLVVLFNKKDVETLTIDNNQVNTGNISTIKNYLI